MQLIKTNEFTPKVPKTTTWNGSKRTKNSVNSVLGKEKIYIRFLVKQYGTIDSSL